jgi:ribosomal protein S18 acetylase RimI-like enzyme
VTAIDVSRLRPSDVDGVWAFFRRMPDQDRTFVKEPVDDLATVQRWVGETGAVRLVATVSDLVVGYAVVRSGVGWSSHVGELRLVVDADERRKGIGHRLARHALAAAIDAGLTKVVVEVAASQDSTIALFNNLGFHAEALLEDHVRDRNGVFSDLIVLATRVDEDWALMNSVGLDAPLD